jgi:hypothetical protein
MKKSELSFKCVVPNKNAGMRIRLALKNIGLIKNTEDDYAHYQFFAYNRGIIATTNADVFCFWSEPLMNYEDALKLIESVEPDAPEFDIKPLQPVLKKKKPQKTGHNDTTWELDLYANKINFSNFSCIGDKHADCIISYPENRSLCGEFDYPAGWWECENGKPVWKTK